MNNYHFVGHRGCCDSNYGHNGGYENQCHRKGHEGCECRCKHHQKEEKDCSQHGGDRNKELIRDCMSVDWTVPNDSTQTVYYSQRIEGLTASGFIRYDCGSSAYIVASFFLGQEEVTRPIRVYKDSNVAFTVNRFDSIRIHCPHDNGQNDPECPDACEGELSIIPRYFM